MMEKQTDHTSRAFEIEVNGRSYYEKDSILDNLILFLGRVVSLKSPYTMNHSNNVRNLSLQLVQCVEYPMESLKALEYAAALHDIGKIAVSEYVINKPTLLTELEELMMQQHTVLGKKLIQPLQLDPLIGDVVLFHHENFDGSGYPNELKGEQIPLAARIVRIADTYDAMTSARPYRAAYSHEQALELLKDNCQCFDPLILDAFLKMNIVSP